MPAALDKRIDWPELWGEWVKAEAQGMTLTAFAEKTNHPRSYLSVKFKEMQNDLIKGQMANVVRRGVHIVSESLKNPDVNPDFALKASVSMADRIGLAPQNQQVNVQNNIAIGISLVAKEDAESIKSMLGGEDVQSSSSNPGASE